TGWTTNGTVSVTSTTDSFNIGGSPYSLTPAAGESMAKILPSGSSISGAAAFDTALGLTAGTIASMLDNDAGSVTNLRILSKSFTLAAGTYSFAWPYAARDYQPYNDGGIFTVTGGGLQIATSRARNGSSPDDTSGPSANTLILGS